MASTAIDDGGIDALVVLKCTDRQKQSDNNNNQDNDEVTISTTDVCDWDFSSILQHRIINVIAHRNRLIEHSSYFHGLLGGNFSDPDVGVLVEWNQPTFLSLLASLYGSEVDLTSSNFLPMFEGALYFGMETILSKCKIWLAEATSVNGFPLVQLNDLVSIWNFGSQLVNYLPEICTSYLAKNFIWAISCSSFINIPHDLLLSTIHHPHLTVDSEKQLCEAILGWIAANKEQFTKDMCIKLLKQIRVSLLPLWFAAGKNTYQFLSICSNGSFYGANTLLKQPLACRMNEHGDDELLNLRIRLTEFTQRVDLSHCPQITPTILLLSMLPHSDISEPLSRRKFEQLLNNHERIVGPAFRTSCEMWSMLTFEGVHEINISNCPMLHLEVVVECFHKSFPSLTTLKATNHLSFTTTKLLLWLVKRFPLLCDIDLTVDLSPVIPTRVSIVSSFDITTSPSPVSLSYFSSPLPSNITKLTLAGRNDISDFDLRIISDICVSLTYLSLKGCVSVSDVGISSLLSKCLKLNSILACDTFFGQQSILALCSSNACSYLQMLHMGGCKGINMASFSKLMSQAHMMKNLCLRETEIVDDCLFNIISSSLETLDVSNTKVSAAAMAHVISRNPGLKCLKGRGCNNLLQNESESETKGGKFLQFPSKNLYIMLGKLCKLDELSVGWGFSYFSLKALKPSISLLKALEVGLGGSLGQNGLKLLPEICPLLESVVLYFQVISDDLIVNMLESLKHLKSFVLCHCLGDISSSIFSVKMPNLKRLRLERVAAWMKNSDLIVLSQNCANLIELSLLGCRFLNSESLKIISSGWPGLISIHLEECGEVTSNGVDALFECHALEDVLLRHNGSGIQKSFIGDAVKKLPMLRITSLDICDAKDRDFDIPEFDDRHFLSHVKIARCKSHRCSFDQQHVWASSPVHSETLVLVWDSKRLAKTLVKERV